MSIESPHPDTIVIHHTATDPDASLDYLNTLGLLRLYIPPYRSGFRENALPQPISSGHFYEGKQVFWGYHHIIRPDGASTQILKDSYTGFHAGDWPTNCRSIGIALVDDLTYHPPTPEALATLNSLIAKYNPARVLGHGEVIFWKTGKPVETECPGKTYYFPSGWKIAVSISKTIK